MPLLCRTRRVWKPNVITKAVYSEALDKMIRLNMTTAALRFAFHIRCEILSSKGV